MEVVKLPAFFTLTSVENSEISPWILLVERIQLYEDFKSSIKITLVKAK